MSVFVLAKDHIDSLVTAWIELARVADRSAAYERKDQANAVGAMLTAENEASYRHRYAHHDSDNELLPVIAYEYTPIPVPGGIVAMLPSLFKLIDCYEYQSDEHPGWRDSQARTWIEDLRREAWRALPGYDMAPWGATDLHAFEHPSIRVVQGEIADMRRMIARADDAAERLRAGGLTDHSVDPRKTMHAMLAYLESLHARMIEAPSRRR